ncbi:effector-associated domain 2-containing protein [Streptomyces sp. NBC_00009]|uniref:VMAP-C domain-containing protein n=1 Tax=Streptomyces sp. NBC_00009 TaxID=2975620 RepID=UPI00324AA900
MPERPSPYPAFPASEEQLVEALMRVSVMEDRRSRRMCVDRALHRLGQRLSVAEFADKKPHIVEMVRVFGAVPQGWLRLVEAVRYLADDDLASLQASALVESPLPPAGDPAQRAALDPLLSGLDRGSVPDLADLFRHVAGDSFGPLPRTTRTAREAYELLEQCNVPSDGIPRSVRFLHELAYLVGPERGDPLRVWLSRHIRSLADAGPGGQRMLEAVRTSTGSWRRDPGREAFLVIRLQPLTESPDRVALTCWTSTGNAWEPRQRDDRELRLTEVPDWVATLVDREEERLRNHHGGIVVEFILSLAMANTPVEDWTRPTPFGPRQPGLGTSAPYRPPLGMDYKVVIRSLERMEARQVHRVWNARWEVLRSGGAGRVHRCETGAGSQQQALYAKLKHNQAIVLMTLGSSPDSEHGLSELTLGLQAGLPVLLWAHQGPLDDTEHAELHRLAETGAWDDLLETVTRLRFSPRTRDDGPEGSIDSRIAVLWDDPSRLPEVPESAS